MEYLVFVLIPIAILGAGVAAFFMALALRRRAALIENNLAILAKASGLDSVREEEIARRFAGLEDRLTLLEARLSPAAPSPDASVVPEPAPVAAPAPPVTARGPQIEAAPGEMPSEAGPETPTEPAAEELPVAAQDRAEPWPDWRRRFPRREGAAPDETASPEEALSSGQTPPQIEPAETLEARLGGRWAVWIGGFAVALGGLFLVRYSIEQGYFSPAVRIAAGALLALGLIVAGEWTRRRRAPSRLGAFAAADIPSVLTAAGTVAAFGTIYAAHALYDFIGPAAAFVLLGAVGLATLAAAALHAPWLAGIGLVGALATPLLVVSDSENPWPVVIYLAVVVGAADILANIRSWLWLLIAATAGAVIWGVLLAGGAEAPAAMAHALIQTALALAFAVIEPHREIGDEAAFPEPVATGAGIALLGLAALVLDASVGDPWWLGFALTLVGLHALAGALYPAAAGLLPGAVLLGLAALTLWPALADTPASGPVRDPGPLDLLPFPDGAAAFLETAAFVGLAPAALAARRLWIGPHLPFVTGAILAAALALGPLAALVLAYLRISQFERSLAFAGAALALGVAFTGLAALLREKAEQTVAIRLGLGAAASAAVAALALALSLALDRGVLTVSLALAALGAAWVATRADIPALRVAVGALGLVVLGRLVWDPRIAGPDLGTFPILNWLLWGYGVPALAFGLSAWLLRFVREDWVVRLCEALAVLFAALLVFFEIRHALNGGNPFARSTGHVEIGLFAVSAFGFAGALMWLDARRADPVFDIGATVFSVASALLVLVGLGSAVNPLIAGDAIEGGPVLNSLLLGYLLPALGAALLARLSENLRPGWYRAAIAWLAIALLFGYVSLEVRRLFQGPEIGWLRPTSDVEWWAYSAAWLAIGLLLLAYGLLRRFRPARLASAAFVSLTVVKVFVFDLSGLEGPLRALSFIGLGLVLLGIGWLYQRLLARGLAAA